MDSRHEKRQALLQKLFALGFEQTAVDPEVSPIQEHLAPIDDLIRRHATRYPLETIARVDLAILRLALFELCIEKKNPEKVVIDEAVTLAREFGNEKSYAFVNGVLGSVLNERSK